MLIAAIASGVRAGDARARDHRPIEGSLLDLDQTILK
jgi:hypothetical protein